MNNLGKKMSETTNNMVNEFFKVQQISDYQKAFEELKNRNNNKRLSIDTSRSRIIRNPANDNNPATSHEPCNRKKVIKKSYCCVML